MELILGNQLKTEQTQKLILSTEMIFCSLPAESWRISFPKK